MIFKNKFKIPDSIEIDLDKEKDRLIIDLIDAIKKQSQKGGSNIYNTPESILGPTPDKVIQFIDLIINILEIVSETKKESPYASLTGFPPTIPTESIRISYKRRNTTFKRVY